MAGHEDAWVLTGHIGTNTHPNLYPLAGDDRPLTLLKRGWANSVVGLELADYPKDPAILKTLRIVNHYGEVNLHPLN